MGKKYFEIYGGEWVMNNELSLLVSVVLDGKYLIKTAIKVDGEVFTDNYYLEEDNKKKLSELLPEHCRGKIVEVVEIFEVRVAE